MKTAGIWNWDKIRDWLAEAGMACSGCYFDYEESRVPRSELLPRRRFDKPRHAVRADAAAGWTASNHGL